MGQKLAVVVTGATGKQGGAVVKSLLERGHQVRAVTRSTDSAKARELANAGVELVRASLEDTAALAKALEGATSLFAMTTPFEGGTQAEARQGISAANAAKAAGVHLVFTSAGSANRQTGIPHFDSKYEVEKHIGKIGVRATVLAPVFLQRASGLGPLLIGWGACVEQRGSAQPYLPVLDAIRALCRGRGADRVVDVLTRHAPAWLVQIPGVVPLDRLDDLQRRAAGATQARILCELADALEALSVSAPVVLVLDDLQWADPSTAELIAFLGSRREPAQLLIVGTYRLEEAPRSHPLTRLTSELIAHRRALSITLCGLTSDAVDEYLAKRYPGHTFPRELARTLERSTGGNPLFLTTLVDDLEAQGLIRQEADRWGLSTAVKDIAARRPDSIRRLIDLQIDRLGVLEQRIVEVAAVAGMTFTAGVVAHALEADTHDVDSVCESLANERRLLRYLGIESWPDGTIQTRYSFRHALFQDAALARSTAATMRARHRKMTERLDLGYAGQETKH